MNQDELVYALKTFLLLCLVFGLLYFGVAYMEKRRFEKLIRDISSVPSDAFPELSRKYELYLREQYNIELSDMSYEECIQYIATHFKILNLRYKKYFPEGKNWTIIAAAAKLGELIQSRYNAKWSKPNIGLPAPILHITIDNKKPWKCNIFGVLISQLGFDEDTNIIQDECLGYTANGVRSKPKIYKQDML